MDFNSRTSGAGENTRKTAVALSLGALVSLVGWTSSSAVAEMGETASAAKPAVMLRAKSPMSRQPRPTSAPIKHLGERANTAVTLLGIETADGPERDPATTTLMGEWTRARLVIAPEQPSRN